MQFEHIQHNDPLEFRWLFFDIDRKHAALSWEEAGLQAPNVIIENSDNGHAHLGYVLRSPVTALTCNGRDHPLDYYEAVERGFGRRLDADPAYSALIAKNPLHKKWRTSWPAGMPYNLGDLAKDLTRDDMRRPRHTENLVGVGRNCTIFDELREIAYREVNGFKRERRSAET